MLTFEFHPRGRSALRSHKVCCRLCNSTSMGLYFVVFTIFYLVLYSSPVTGSDSPPCMSSCAKMLSSSTSKNQATDKCVKILLLNTTDLKLPFASSINAGFFASLFSRGCQFGAGYTIEFVSKETQYNNIVKDLNETVNRNPDILALAMLYGDTSTMIVLPTLVKHNMVLFSPITGSSKVRFWHRNLYFIRSSPTGELFALLRYALNTLHYRRLGFMYLQGVNFGDTEYKLAVDELARMGRSICCTFRIKTNSDGDADPSEVKAAFDKFAEGRPQATIVFGSPILACAKFLQHFWTDPRTKGGILLAPSSLHFFIVVQHMALVKSDASSFSGKLISTGTSPLAKEDNFDAIKRFQKDMRQYLSQSGQGDFKDTEVFLHNDMVGETMVGGWLAGETLVQALSTLEWKQGKVAFMNSLYNQRRYIIDDLVIGDFGGDCSKIAVSQGAVCQCNQGGKTVYMKEISKDYSALPLPDGMMSFPPTDCFTSKVRLRAQLSSVMFLLEDNAAAKEISNHMSIGIRAAGSFADAFDQSSEFSVSSIATKDSTAVDDLQHTLLEKDVDALIGYAPRTAMELDNLVFISPFSRKPRLNVYYRHVISILPTVEQQFFRVSHYFQSARITTVHALIRSDEGQGMIDVLRKSLETFDVWLSSSRVLSDEEALDGKMPDTGDSVIVGITAKDLPVIAAYLESHSISRVVILFQDLCMLYGELVAAFTGKSIAHRLLFVTNLPHWSDKHSTSKTGEMFLSAIANETLRTPLAMAGFAIARFVHYASAHLVVVNSTTFLEFIYSTPMISSDDMLYGPFFDKQNCEKDEKNPMTCQINFGATFMSVWSMARSLNSSVPPLLREEVPSLTYRSSSSRTLSNNEIAAVIVGSVVGFSLISAFIVVAAFRCVKNKKLFHAPKDMEHPVTLIFTDIQSSTALWAAIPEFMADALETHHRLIRRLIVKYECYEVKTIGDSFMIACKSASAAVQLVVDLQRTFLQHDWGTSAMDAAYHEFEERQAEEDADYEPPTARLDAAVYRKYWSGLRVRAGVHTGLSDIRHDEVTRGYDYYGSTSNTAARTESVAHGGQVLLTGAAYMALSAAERAGLDVTALGPVELRGVPQPVEVYQLNAVPGRAFAKLRLDREVGDGECISLLEGSSSTLRKDENSAAVESFAAVLSCAFRAFPASQRMKYLAPLCERWGLSVPQKTASVSHETHCARVILMLARKQQRFLQGGVLSSKGDLNSIKAFESITTKRGFEQSHTSLCSVRRSQDIEVDNPNLSTSNSIVVRPRRSLRDMFDGW